MGVWEGRLVMFESLVNQQIHPLSFFLLYHSPSFSPSHPISSFSPSRAGSTAWVQAAAEAQNTPGTERGNGRKEEKQNRAGGLRVESSEARNVAG